MLNIWLNELFNLFQLYPCTNVQIIYIVMLYNANKSYLCVQNVNKDKFNFYLQ